MKTGRVQLPVDHAHCWAPQCSPELTPETSVQSIPWALEADVHTSTLGSTCRNSTGNICRVIMFPEQLISKSNIMWRPPSPLTGCDKKGTSPLRSTSEPHNSGLPRRKTSGRPRLETFSKHRSCAPPHGPALQSKQ